MEVEVDILWLDILDFDQKAYIHSTFKGFVTEMSFSPSTTFLS
jgi:hypothetical protein